ncbi:hypothetical protein HAL013_09320 [Helicobacter ailurogastricus]|uniref:Uncharacterized protein n=1 Tax=Helicobacter ailurogastricus TaxID=1578720 RepID=A0A0K2XH32_9HELI|nr:hypothetical protein HAL011_05570 [Helicobacter ailurogastricus]CRF42732.1 hypothetical protein HAL013_09320 [Helicobacter ailurogastricus]CRF44903.1 hypothetical protein HAL09_15240 [Helicobacter ailurogastricus]
MFSLILDFKKVGYNNPRGQARLNGEPPERVSVMVGLTRPLQSQGLQKIACWYSFLRSYPLILFPLKRFICVIRQNSDKEKPHWTQWPYYSKVCSLILDFKKVGYNNPRGRPALAGRPPLKWVNITAALTEPLLPRWLLTVSCWYSFLRSYPLLSLPTQTQLKLCDTPISAKKSQHCIQCPHYSKVCSLILDFKKVGYNSPCVGTRPCGQAPKPYQLSGMVSTTINTRIITKRIAVLPSGAETQRVFLTAFIPFPSQQSLNSAILQKTKKENYDGVQCPYYSAFHHKQGLKQ